MDGLPIPELSLDSMTFWKAGEKGELRINRCGDCGLWIYPPKPVCRRCRGRSITADLVSGRGIVYTYTISRQQYLPGVDGPYIVAVIELAEDPQLRMTTRLVDIDETQVHIGLEVAVRFEQREDMWIPVFGPAPQEATEGTPES